MPWSKKTWKDRVTEYPNRRRLDATGAENTYDVARDEGNIIVEGDAFDAQTMNDLETRIDEGISDITGSIGKPDGIQPQTAARNTIVKADASGNLVAAEEGKDSKTQKYRSCQRRLPGRVHLHFRNQYQPIKPFRGNLGRLWNRAYASGCGYHAE